MVWVGGFNEIMSMATPFWVACNFKGKSQAEESLRSFVDLKENGGYKLYSYVTLRMLCQGRTQYQYIVRVISKNNLLYSCPRNEQPKPLTS